MCSRRFLAAVSHILFHDRGNGLLTIAELVNHKTSTANVLVALKLALRDTQEWRCGRTASETEKHMYMHLLEGERGQCDVEGESICSGEGKSWIRHGGSVSRP